MTEEVQAIIIHDMNSSDLVSYVILQNIIRAMHHAGMHREFRTRDTTGM